VRPAAGAAERRLVAALALAAALRVLVFGFAVSSPARFFTRDSLGYDRLAHNFHRAYVVVRHGPLFDLSLLRPPGYPALIAVVDTLGGGATAVIVVELVLSVATVALTYALAAALCGKRIAAAAAVLLAVDPISIAMGSNLTTETLFAWLAVLAALAWGLGLLRRDWRLGAVAGFLVGLSVLVRPLSVYLPIVLALVTLLLLRRRGIALTVALLLAAAIPIGGWLARNAATSGVATVSTIQAENLLDYRAAGALGIDEGIPRLEAAQRLEAQIRPGPNAARTAQRQSSLAWRTLLHHPGGAAVMTAEGLARVLFGPGRAEVLRLVAGRTDTRTLGDRALVVCEAAVLFATLALAALGTVLLVRRRSWPALAVPLVFALYDVLLSAGPEGNARLRMPAAPFFAVLAAVGISSLVARSAGRSASPSR
jgi:4-amino-4-deoxy-L-arabinose transferase-like glycosyltransferase